LSSRGADLGGVKVRGGAFCTRGTKLSPIYRGGRRSEKKEPCNFGCTPGMRRRKNKGAFPHMGEGSKAGKGKTTLISC